MRNSDRKQKVKIKDGVFINSGCPQSLILLSEGSVGTYNQPAKLSNKQVHTVAMEREMKVTRKIISWQQNTALHIKLLRYLYIVSRRYLYIANNAQDDKYSSTGQRIKMSQSWHKPVIDTVLGLIILLAMFCPFFSFILLY